MDISSLNSSNTFPASAYNLPRSELLVRLTIPSMGFHSPHGVGLTANKRTADYPTMGDSVDEPKLLACYIPLFTKWEDKALDKPDRKRLDSRPQSGAAPSLLTR